MPRSLDHLIREALHNKGLKLLALVLAAATWLFIREATSFETTVRDIPLEVLLPEGVAIQERSVNVVAVTFRGSQADIRNLNKDQVRVQVDARIRQNDSGLLLPLTLNMVSAPRSVRVMDVEPAEVKLTLDREIEKVVPIELVKAGDPPEGYFVEKFILTPEKMTIYGPARRLADVDVVRTMPVDMAGRISTFTINNHALMSPGENWQARMSVEKVSIRFVIAERTLRQDFTNVPVKIMASPGAERNLSIFPDRVNISLQGRFDVITNLIAANVHAFVDYSRLPEEEGGDLPVEITTLPGVNVIVVDPATVRVHVEGKKR